MVAQDRAELSVVKRRMEAAFLLFMAGVLVVGLRLGYIQWMKGRDFGHLAAKMQGRVMEIDARRGDLLDRSGRALAMDMLAKAIIINPRIVSDPEATAAAICQAKGCWMTIADGEGEPIWVRWSSGCGGKYAFPKDAAGRRMIVQGSFYEKEIDAAAAEHLAAENETLDKDAIVGKAFEMNATGCVVLPVEGEAKGA